MFCQWKSRKPLWSYEQAMKNGKRHGPNDRLACSFQIHCAGVQIQKNGSSTAIQIRTAVYIQRTGNTQTVRLMGCFLMKACPFIHDALRCQWQLTTPSPQPSLYPHRKSNPLRPHDVRPPAEVGAPETGSEVLPAARGLSDGEQQRPGWVPGSSPFNSILQWLYWHQTCCK